MIWICGSRTGRGCDRTLMAARLPVAFCLAAQTVPKEPAPRTEVNE